MSGAPKFFDGDLIADLGDGRQLFAIEHAGPGQIVYVGSSDPTPVHLPAKDPTIGDMLDEEEQRELGVLLRRIQEQLDAAGPDRFARALTIGLHRAGLTESVDATTEDAVRSVVTEAWGVV